MTSLQRQLEALRTPATSRLGTERFVGSLLFDRKQAASLYKEEAHKIGQSGLAQLRRVDPEICDNESAALFEESALNVERSLLSKDENEKLNENIDRLIAQISPYLQHFAAQQILEWLLYKYQVNEFNAERLFIAFLPFHSTNIFGRLLSLLRLKGIEYDWIREYAKSESPIPFEKIVSKCFSSNHSLLSILHQHIEHLLQLIGADEMESKMPQLFSFHAKLCVHLVSDPAKLNDSIIAKILPFLATSLKSRIISLRLSALMTVCQLCVTVTLSDTVIKSLLKLILLKMNQSTAQHSINTAFVICQHQQVDSLPSKGVRKLARKSEQLNVPSHIVSLNKTTDSSALLQPLWRTLFQLISESADGDEHQNELCSFLVSTIQQGDTLAASSASAFFSNVFEFLSASEVNAEKMSEDFYGCVRSLILRFGESFDTIRAEWKVRNESVVDELIKRCKIEAHEIGDIAMEAKPTGKRRRRSSNSIRKSACEGDEARFGDKHGPAPDKNKQVVMEEQLNALRVKPKQVFKGDPISKLGDLIKSEKWDKVKLGIEALTAPKYIKQRIADDFETFIIEMVGVITSRESIPVKADLRNALSMLPIKCELACMLLSRFSVEPEGKRKRAENNDASLRKNEIFRDEDENAYLNRVKFVLELLSANQQLEASSQIFVILFDIFKMSMNSNDSDEVHSTHSYIQQLVVSLLVRLLKEPHGYKITKQDLQLDCVVETIRRTRDHNTLRSCLSLLTAAVHISSSSVISHMMSVFTFMGAGLLKKDNDLTLEIIEQTLNALFGAIMDEKGEALLTRLVSVSRILSASMLDMPAHRRLSVVTSIATAIHAQHLPIICAVLFEHYCITWQRNDSNKGRPTIEIFEELATEMASLFDGAEQLSCAVDLLEYIVELGGDSSELSGNSTGLNTSSSAQKNKRAASSSSSSTPIFSNLVFDRSKHSVQKLRHYRFTLIGWIARLLSSQQLLDKLSEMTDAEMYERLLVIGKRMLISSVELDTMVSRECERYDKRDGLETTSETAAASLSNNYRYWIAFASRADILADKLRNILPANVSARLIANILEDSGEVENEKIRDCALHLLNVKLNLDVSFNSTQNGISSEHLNAFAQQLNRWIKPVESKHEVVLCQNAAFSLKLIAKRIPPNDSAPALSSSIALCTELLGNWRSFDEAMVGSILLLAGELVRRQSTRNTLQYVNKLCAISLDILMEQLDSSASQQQQQQHVVSPLKLSTDKPNVSSTEQLSSITKRKRIAQQSLSGKRIGGDVLLQCSLTALQRIVENFAHFISAHLKAVLITVSRTIARHITSIAQIENIGNSNNSETVRLSNVEYRIGQIKKALSKLEIRLLIEPFQEASQQLINNPEAEVALFSILSLCLHAKYRDELLKYLAPICEQYFIAFNLRVLNRSVEKYDRIVECENMLIDYWMRIIDCLSENECRPIVQRFTKWAEEAIQKECSDISALHVITVFNLFNRFYNSYNALALPHFGRIFEKIPGVLQRCNARLTDSDMLLYRCKKGSIGVIDTNALIILSLSLIEKCARHHEFFVEERAQLVIDSVVNELENTTVQGHQQRCIPYLADCLLQIIDCHNEMITETVNKIMLKTRNTSHKVRYCTLLVLERMFDRMGDAVAPLLPSVLPFLSELLEDEKKNVEEQCDKVISLLRRKFGDEIAEGYI